jgi:UDPglucose 6-dehydrogenase
VAASIGRRGGDVVIYDPQAMDNARREHPELAYVASLDEALAGADVTMILTEWDEFQAMDPVAVGEKVAQRNMVDGRNILDPVKWRKSGWRYRALGRP